MKHLVAATAITVLTLIGFGTIASAAWADSGTAMCHQPGSNPPIMVPCDSPEATTPITVPPTTTTAPAPVTPGTPVSPQPLANGRCVQPGSNPPFIVPCDDPAATMPYAPPLREVAATSPATRVEMATTEDPSTPADTPTVKHAPARKAPRPIITFGDALVAFVS